MLNHKTIEIQWAELQADCYAGENCDEVEKQWKAFAHGDKDSEILTGNFEIDPTILPIGTKITISVPECPDCKTACELLGGGKFGCMDQNCKFNWDDWVLSQYS